MTREPIKLLIMMFNMNPSKPFKENMSRIMILEKTQLFFSSESTVGVQLEDRGPWMHRVIEEDNSSDHEG